MNKSVETRKNELSGEVVKEFLLYEDFYTFQKNEMKRLKKDKESVMQLFANQRPTHLVNPEVWDGFLARRTA